MISYCALNYDVVKCAVKVDRRHCGTRAQKKQTIGLSSLILVVISLVSLPFFSTEIWIWISEHGIINRVHFPKGMNFP